ncbi:MAG: flagellar export protein FliJ [Eubacteriales bacterium]|jgi:flagellar FliJ protein|nr:flagellar export protein FliJ [Eubacteriales bacterium]
MRKFKFSLQFLLNIRKSEEKSVEAQLQSWRSKVAALEQELGALLGKRQMYEDKLKEEYSKGMTPQNLHNWNLYLSALKSEIDEMELKVVSAKEECNKILNKLLEIKKTVKMLETLKDKRYKEYLDEEAKEEHKITDEFVCANYVR